MTTKPTKLTKLTKPTDMTRATPPEIGAVAAQAGSAVRFTGLTAGRGELLRSPVSGVSCVHWRLRIVEQVNATLQLVHEIASPDAFDVTWSVTSGAAACGGPGAVRIRIVPEAASIEAAPVLYRAGSPGALAVARRFGFSGQLSVEEVALHAGEEITAEGILEEMSGSGEASGPFRGVERELELLEVTVRVPVRAALGPALLPWALGTAAALLAGVGAAGWAARHFDLLPFFHQGAVPLPAEIGPDRPVRRHFSQPE